MTGPQRDTTDRALFISAQFKIVSTCSVKPICAPPARLSDVARVTAVGLSDDGLFSLFRGGYRRALALLSSLSASLSPSLTFLRAIESVMFLALYPQAVSQAPQHLGSSETQATWHGCFVLCQLGQRQSRLPPPPPASILQDELERL